MDLYLHILVYDFLIKLDLFFVLKITFEDLKNFYI